MEQKKKKVIIVGPAYPYRGGPSTYVSYIYSVLKDKFEVKIYNYKVLYPDLLFPGKTQYDKSIDKKFIVPSERIINSINPFNWITTAAKIAEENAGLVLFDWWHPFFAPCHFSISLLIRKKYKSRIVFITENYISHEQNSVDKILTRIGLSNAGSFIALSQIVMDQLKLNFPGKKIYRSSLPPFDLFSEQISFNREEERQKLGISPGDKVLLFFGYVRKYKGLDILIEAMPALLKKIPAVKLLVVGEFYDDPSVYTEMINKYSLNDNIIIKNEFVSNEEVGRYFSAADLSVLPYRGATQSAVLNVAYSFKMPAVVTNVGGLGEFVKDMETGIIVKPESPEALAEGILKYFSVKDKINFSRNIENYTGAAEFSQMPELIDRILEESGN